MNEEQDLITLVDEKGQEQLYEVSFTFAEEYKYNKNYILMYPAGAGDEDDVDVLAFSFDPNEADTEGSLEQIEDDEEWVMVEEHLNQYLDEAE